MRESVHLPEAPPGVPEADVSKGAGDIVLDQSAMPKGGGFEGEDDGGHQTGGSPERAGAPSPQ